jgi:HSP20 family protein
MAKEIERSGKSGEVTPRYSDPVRHAALGNGPAFRQFSWRWTSNLSKPVYRRARPRLYARANMDVKETDKEIVIEAELPGMEEKDVSLTLQEGVLTVQGEKKIEYDEDKENDHMMERRYGSFQRSLRLPDTVDEDKVEARFENGVLRITLPKRPEAGGAQRKIEIKTGKA